MRPNYKIVVHHVGGRGGSRSFPILKKFEKDVINVIYDSDRDCIDQIREKNEKLDSELHVLSYCLSDKCGPATLNINYDPYTSSLLESNESINSFYMFYFNHDYIMGETARTMERRQVDAVTLDHLFDSEVVVLEKPDFLSIDIEGAEYNALQGTEETLKSNILSVFSEVTFHPFKKNQKQFGDICDFLSDRGFYFVALKEKNNAIMMQEMSPFRYPVGLRGKGFHTLSEALFLRRIDSVKNFCNNNLDLYVNLRKLAFISIAFNQLEYGLECLNQSSSLELDFTKSCQSENMPTYLKFLKEIEEQVNRTIALFPPTFSDLYTFEQSKLRFVNDQDFNAEIREENSIKHSVKVFLMKYSPFLLMIIRKRWFIIFKIKRAFLFKNKRNIEYYSKVEKILIKYELHSLADIIREKRISQSRFTVHN